MSMDAMHDARTLPLPGQDDPDEAGFALLQATLLEEFAAWLKTDVPGNAIPDAAGRVLNRFSEEVLDELLKAAGRQADPGTRHRLRWEFSQAVGHFGQALRAQVPAAQRHAAAQILQVRTLEAERCLHEALAGPDS